jgi:hypothetical protein
MKYNTILDVDAIIERERHSKQDLPVRGVSGSREEPPDD